nr:MAG TPA: hypothetical protein [Caudoviricetes sp.]
MNYTGTRIIFREKWAALTMFFSLYQKPANSV